jgi:aryl-alcohol dehydrogenase-like predicted oxidoreductase
MRESWQTAVLGRTGIRTSRLGLGSTFGLSTADIHHAFERGVRYFYWGSVRRPAFGVGVRELARTHRDEMTVVVQSYARVAAMMSWSIDAARWRLGLDYFDVLLLGWWNAMPPASILDAAAALVDAGRVRTVMVSCHHRPSFELFAREPRIGAFMVRYNAAHIGAESEVFPRLGESPPGVVAYTATRWGDLLQPSLVPAGESVPGASDCYRFALSHPAVDVVAAGPAGRAQLDEALAALDRGPMSDDELAWMKRVGAAVRSRARAQSTAVGLIDRLMGGGT